MATPTKWILASASPRRREILSGLGLRFTVAASTLTEPSRRIGESPSRYAVRAALCKTRKVAARRKSGVVIGADTIVVAGDRIMGKPADKAEARDMLRSLSGSWHEVITGICLCDCARQKERKTASVSRVHFRPLDPAEISWYLDSGEYHDKAGGYAIQGLASIFIDRIEGCYFNIVGFPVSAFERLCHSMDISLISEMSVSRGRSGIKSPDS